MKIPALASVLEALTLDPLAHGLQILDASELGADAFPRLDTDRPALLFNAAGGEMLSAIARTLCANYPLDHPLAIVQGKRVKRVALETLASSNVRGQAVLYVAPLAHASSPLTLANIMARLRAPRGGCPWDLEQTHASITRALVEETYEVIEAISDNDMLHLREELGDLWLHVLFQTQIAHDQGEFLLSEVGAELAAKLIRRHPHVFGDAEAADAGAVLQNWDKIKQAEKQEKGLAAHAETLDSGIPRDLPALTRAQKVNERARRKQLPVPAGALGPGMARALKSKRAARREEMLGEMLLELAALAEEHGIDAERALHAATRRFVQGRPAPKEKRQAG